MRRDATDLPPSKLERDAPARRRARLKRGVERFAQAVQLTGGCRYDARLLLFTVRSADVGDVQGQIRRFWHTVRARFGPQRYFAWLELQRRGAPHYHAIWLDAPLPDTRASKAWLERTWGLGFVKVRTMPRRWANAKASRYVKSYAKKIGGKAYQQDYTDVPPTIRTFVTNRWGVPADELDAHRDRLRGDLQIESERRRGDPLEFRFIPTHFEIHQVAAAGACALQARAIAYRGRTKAPSNFHSRRGFPKQKGSTSANPPLIRRA